jgi:hypothetical protein
MRSSVACASSRASATIWSRTLGSLKSRSRVERGSVRSILPGVDAVMASAYAHAPKLSQACHMGITAETQVTWRRAGQNARAAK